jgi:predicted Zn finger-like uncharacterized protein
MGDLGIRSIVCPACNNAYKIPESKIPPKGATATCKKCGGSIFIQGLQRGVSGVVNGFPTATKPTSTSRSEKVVSPSDLTLLADYPELQDMTSTKLDYGEIFKPKKSGSYKSSLNKYKVKTLKSVHGMIEKILNEGERVLRTGSGTAYYPAEIFFGNGYLTMMYNRYTILCTDQRMLLINTDNKMRHPTHYLFQVPYSNLKKVKTGFFSTQLILNMVKGKRRTFTGIKRGSVKELFQFLKERIEDPLKTSSSEEVLENLCPSCFLPLKEGLSGCTRCQKAFKEPTKAMLRSLALPGLGDFYLGHRLLGSLEMISAVFVWLIVISNIIIAGDYFISILLVFINGTDAALTYHMAKKGYILAGT